LAAPLLVAAVFAAGRNASPAASSVEVGSALGGQHAVEYVGQVEQVGGVFTSTGYLTRISGLTDTLLFSGTIPFVRDETNARFTYYATATLTSHYVISNVSVVGSSTLTTSVFVIDSVGTTVYYYNPPGGAHFGNPASFKVGQPIVTATVRSQNILNVQAPNLGVGTNIGELAQTGVSAFDLGGQTYQIGRVGLMERTFSTGEGTRTDPITPKSITILSGNAIVTGLPGQQSFMPIIIHNGP
jgi:hypothetical protein